MHKTLKFIIIGIVAGAAVGGFFALYARATGFNEQINYQGKLTNSTGVAIADGYYCMKFVVYPALATGSALWTEKWKTDNAHKVQTVNGLFSVMLGSQTTFSSENLDFNSNSLYLEVQLDTNCDDAEPYEEVFAPRKQLGTVPAAFEAKQLGGATWAAPGTIGSGTPSAAYFTTLSATTYNGLTLASGSSQFTIAGGTTSKTLTVLGNFTTSGGTSGYNAYWSGTDTLGSEAYTATSRGGTGANWSAVATGSMPYFSGLGTMGTISAGTSGWVFTSNGANTAPSWTATAMTYPGAGIANSTGTAWGTSYTTTGSGTVVALQTSPSFTTPTLGVATATSYNGLTLATATTGFTIAGGTTSKTLTISETGTAVVGTGTTNYNAYWTGDNTLSFEQYLATSRGGLGANMTAGAIGAIPYSTSTTAYGTIAAATSGWVFTSGGANTAPSWVVNAGGSPAGSTGWVQFNNAGAFGATSSMFWDNTNSRLGIGTTAPRTSLDVNGTVTGTNLYVPMPPPVIYTLTAGTGGSMANGTYYYVLTAVDLDGVESTKGAEKTITLSGSNTKVTLDFTYAGYQPSGSVSIKVYRSTTSGVYTTPSYIGIATAASSLVDTAASPSAGAPPATNTANATEISGVIGATSRIAGPLIVTGNGNWTGAIMTVKGLGGTGTGILSLDRPNTGRWATMMWTTGGTTTDWQAGTYYFQGVGNNDFAFYGGTGTVAGAPAGSNIGFTLGSSNGYVGIGRNTQFPNQQLQMSNGDIAVNMAYPTSVSKTITLSGGSLADGTYYYFVTAVNALGGETNMVANPGAVVVSGGAGAAQVSISWTASYGATSYKIYRTTIANYAQLSTLIGTATASPFVDTGFTPGAGGVYAGTAYINRISANGNSYLNGGNLGLGVYAPTAYLHIKAGTSTASSAPLKFTSGTNLTVAASGSMEYDGTNLFFTPGALRKTAGLFDSGNSTTTGSMPYFSGTGYLTSIAAATSGWVLTAQGANTAPSWAANAALTPAGSTGWVQFNNAGAFGATSSMFWDNTNSRLGIGITAPVTKLHQDGGTGVATYHKFTAGTTTGLLSTDGFDIGIDASGNAELRQRENLPMYFYTNNANVMTILANGNVGIATLTPTYGLHVESVSTSNTGTMYINAALNNSGKGLVIDSNTRQDSENSILAFEIINRGGGNTMAATVAGDVGIGITAPAVKLHQDGGNATATYHKFTAGTTTGTTTGHGFNVGIDGTGAAIIMQMEDLPMYFYTNNASAMTILANGNVGIGTTVPTANLQVAQGTAGVGTVSTPGSSTTLTGVGTQFTNTFKIGDTLTVAGETVRTISTITSNTVLDVTVAFSATPRAAVAYTLTGGTRFSVLGNGYVGIGTTAPARRLEIVDASDGAYPLSLYRTANGGGGVTLEFALQNDAPIPARIVYADMYGGITTNTAGFENGYLQFRTIKAGTITDQVKITKDGYVGIGTTSPGTILQVGAGANGVTSDGTIRVGTGNGASGYMTWDFGTNVVNGYNYFIKNRDRSNADFTIQYNTGNVGIGTTSPSYVLDVKAISSVGSATFTGGELDLDDMSSGGTFTGATALNYKVEIDGANDPDPDTFKWSDDGGATWDASAVEITGSVPQALNNGVTVTFTNTTGHTLGNFWTFSTTVTNPFAIQNSAGTRILYVGNNGNVGIGTTAPGSLLTVNGNTDFSAGLTKLNYSASAPTLTTNGQIGVAWVSGDARIYFVASGSQYFVSKTGGFTIPDYETADPISGDKIKEGDVVLGMINQTYGDNAGLHGIWVKWDSVKAQLLAEARGELSKTGTWGEGAITGVVTETLLDKVTNVLTGLGISIKDGVTNITILATQKFSAKTARLDKMEMVDQKTGDIYCTWIENGKWQKVKGDCNSITVATAIEKSQIQNPNDQINSNNQNSNNQNTTPTETPVTTPTTTPAETPAITPAETPATTPTTPVEAAPATSSETITPATQPETPETNAPQETAQAPQVLNISSLASISDINVDYGTALTAVSLPTTVSATLSDGATQSVTITWDNGMPTYDPNTAGTYVFSGVITQPDNITNTNNLNASVNMVVAQQPQEAPVVENPASAAGDLIQSAASSLLNGVWEFIKWLFDSGTKAVSSAPIVQKAGASLVNASILFKSLVGGLFEPIAKWLRW